jgi:ABC-type transport system substrate-binding protein
LYKYFILPLVFIALLSSCYNGNEKEQNIFRYNEQTGIASLDPAFAKNQSIMWPVHQLFNTLVDVDSQLHMVPSLATSWEISPDRKTYWFHLRSDVFFHNDGCFPNGKGRRLTAADVVYSFHRILDKRTASPGAWIFNGKVDSLKPFSAVSDTVLQLRLQRPYNPILGILSMQYCSIVPHEAVETYGSDFRRHPVGSGPFQFVAWEEGLALIMKKNPAYFEHDQAGHRLPYIDGIHVNFFDSKATEFLLFRQKKLDFINDIDASFKDEVLTKAGTLRRQWQHQVTLQTFPYLNVEYFGILVDTASDLVKTSPLRLKKIRQAINCGFDRNKLVLYLRNSLAIPAGAGFVPAGLPSFDSTRVRGYGYDPERARRLIAEAGYANLALPSIRLLTVSIYEDIASFVAKQLEEVGIRVQVEVVQKSLLLDMTSNSKAAFFRGSWIADYPDAENYLSVFYSKNPAPPNYTRFKNQRFDQLFEQSLAETNDSLRYRLYQQADQVVVDEAPVVPLYYDEVIHLIQPYVKDLQPNALNLLELRRVRMDRTQ